MNLHQPALHRRRTEHGFSLIEAIIGIAVISALAIAFFIALQRSVKSLAPNEPKIIAQQDVSNAQTDLKAAAMYDATPLTGLAPGRAVTVTPTSAPTGAAYLQSDTKPATITVQSISAGSSGMQVTFQYDVPAGKAPLTGSSVISIAQRAPGTCNPQLGAKLPLGCPTP